MAKAGCTHLTISAVLLLLAATGFAQVLPFDHYTIADGLPSNWITAIFQDSRGYLWVGGDGGLSVYDGISFKTYTKDDGLPVGLVWWIHESRRSPGTMLIGTHGGGLSRLTNGKITSLPLNKETTAVENILMLILEDSEGVVWCGTYRGMYRVIGDSVAFFSTGSDSGNVEFLEETRNGEILFSIAKGLYRYSPKTAAMQRIELNLDGATLSCAVEDEDGSLWLGTSRGEIWRVQNDRVVAARATPFGGLRSMVDGLDGNLWIAAPTGILKVSKSGFTNGEIVHYKTENGLPESDFICCFRDRENSLWFGSRHKGLLKLAERYVSSFPIDGLQPGLLNRPAVSDSSGHLFVVSSEGLWEIWKNRDRSWERHLHRISGVPGKSKLPEASAGLVSVDIDSKGRLWTALQDGGLYGFSVTHRRDRSSLLSLAHRMQPADTLHGFTAGMLIDHNDQLWYNYWIAMAYLMQIDLATLKVRESYKAHPDLPAGPPYAISPDSAGNLWFGAFRSGASILKFEDGKYHLIRKLTVADGLGGEEVRAIVHRRNGETWIGTRFDGISIYRDGKFRTITTRDGLLSNAVLAMEEDNEGRIWVGTSAGLQYAEHPDSLRFLTNRKLLGKPVGGVGFVTGERVVWSVSAGELTLFEYGLQSPAGEPPLIAITELRVNGRERDIANSTKFTSSENLCVLSFNGLSFKHEKALRYKYRLLGLDDQWQGPTAQQAVTYASLPPGAYKFEVTAINADGVSSAEPSRLEFTILPPFWQRWWFIGMAAAFIGAILYGIHTLRLRRLLAIEKIRSRIATDLHDDIGAGLTLIGLLTEMALQKSGARAQLGHPNNLNGDECKETGATRLQINELSGITKRIGEVARELSGSMSDVVWSINPRHDSVDALQRRLRAFAHDACNAQNIELHFEISKQLLGMKLHPEIRRNILLIVKEALHNMAKYSGSPSVAVQFETNGAEMKVSIKDQGKGFEVDKAKSGNGLVNMRSRAEKVGGRCEIVSEIGKGTSVTAIVPYRP
jgi:signal transduction histidine kinase/ligand-binding sensor domain-containing protein